MEPKQVLLSIAGTEGQQYHDVAIVPGSRTLDILKQLGLSNMQIADEKGGFFPLNADLYPNVRAGQKLFLSPNTVDAGFAR